MPRRRGIARALLIMGAMFAGLCRTVIEPEAARATSLEYEVKAAFLFNFTRFVQWPAEQFEGPDAPFTICIVGEDPFGKTLADIVQGESVNGHKIVVQRTEAEQKSCVMEYFGRNSRAPVSASGVLTIGEGHDFLREGGIIAFVLDEGRVRFDINSKAAVTARLRMSSKLLAVARSVEK